MKISLPINQFMDDVGFPLVAGRVSVFNHDSDTPCAVYTLSGDIYTEALNPIITSEDGRIPTLFFDAAVVDVKVEKANGDGTYELIDTFQSGFNMPDATNDTVVNGIDALKNTNPEVGIVNVYGYDSNVVAPSRYYVWDQTCTDAADDGIVVLSNTTETGRWILLWDDEKLPCTVYGITPGHEANISAFLGYPETVSQWNIRTPRIHRFLPGTYTSNTTFTATRPLYFDNGAKFTLATFNCPSVMIPSNSGYVADFVFTAQNAVAHSSWFRSAQWFFRCGATELYIDVQNHFANTVLTTVCNLTNVNIYGATRIPLTYNSGAYLNLTSCNIQGTHVFDPASDVLKFNGMKWNDTWFVSASLANYDFGLVSEGHRLQFLTTYTTNTMELDSCNSADLWLKRQKVELDKYGSLVSDLYSLDLRGRKVSSIDGAWTTIKNAVVSDTGYIRLAASSATTLENVKANSVSCVGNAAVTATGCTLIFSEKFHGSYLVLVDSVVRGNTLDFIDATVTTLSVQGGSFGDNRQISRVRLPEHTGSWSEDNYASTKNMTFRNCVLGAPVQACGPIAVENCQVNQAIELFPWYENDQWVSTFTFKNNTFYDAAKITLDERSYIDASHINGVTMLGVMTGNMFNQTDSDGFKVRLMDDQTSLVYFLGPYSRLVYHNNTGTCPVELAGTLDYWSGETSQFGGILTFPNAKYRNSVERVVGLIYSAYSVYATSGYTSHFPITWNDGGDSGDENEVRHISNPTVATEMNNIRLMYMPLWFSDPRDENNDMFKVVLACGSNKNPPGWIKWLS